MRSAWASDFLCLASSPAVPPAAFAPGSCRCGGVQYRQSRQDASRNNSSGNVGRWPSRLPQQEWRSRLSRSCLGDVIGVAVGSGVMPLAWLVRASPSRVPAEGPLCGHPLGAVHTRGAGPRSTPSRRRRSRSSLRRSQLAACTTSQKIDELIELVRARCARARRSRQQVPVMDRRALREGPAHRGMRKIRTMASSGPAPT